MNAPKDPAVESARDFAASMVACTGAREVTVTDGPVTVTVTAIAAYQEAAASWGRQTINSLETMAAADAAGERGRGDIYADAAVNQAKFAARWGRLAIGGAQ